MGLAPRQAQHPAHWGGGGLGFELTRDTTTKHGGQSSGSLKATDRAGRFGTFTQWFSAQEYRGKRVRLSAYLKTEQVGQGGGQGRTGLWMRVDGKQQTAIAFDNMQSQPVLGTKDWQEYSVVLDIPPQAEAIFFGCLLIGDGHVWVDDMKFTIVGPEVATTGEPIEPMDRREDETLPGDLADKPLNLDFEN